MDASELILIGKLGGVLHTMYGTILFGGLTALSLQCLDNQLESFLHLLGSQEKLFFFGFQNEQVEQGMFVSLSIVNRGYFKQ